MGELPPLSGRGTGESVITVERDECDSARGAGLDDSVEVSGAGIGLSLVEVVVVVDFRRRRRRRGLSESEPPSM